jgi:Flp pilus assembly protein TadG
MPRLFPVLTRIGPPRFTRRFARDTRGIAAVEFAFVVPIMLLMLVGTVEASRAIGIDRRLSLVTTMVADLVAREQKMNSADLTAIYKIVNQVMSPYDASSLKVSVIPVKASPSDAALTKVYASTTNRPSHNEGAQPSKCSSYSMTAGLLPKGGSVIVVESSYTYEPIFLNYVFGAASWTDKALATPRNSCVDFDSDKCVSTCF